MRWVTMVFVVLGLMAPADVRALDTRTVKVGALTVVAETEGPYVEDTAKQDFALPSVETAVKMDRADWDRLVAFLRKECARNPGCELTVEQETQAVVAARSPSGKGFAPPYGLNTKVTHPGAPAKVEAVLTGWMPDTYALVVQTSAGAYCVLNAYAYKDYYTPAYKFLESIGEPGTALQRDVVVSYYPPADGQAVYDDCLGHLAEIRPR